MSDAEAIPNPPLLDEAALQRLVDMLGVSVMQELVAECLSDARAACEDMRAALPLGDAVRVRRAAHKLSGLLGQYGCPSGAAAARDVAEAGDADALSQSGALLPVVDATAAELERWSSLQ
ncbi:MAG: Hpt domain-containing protein [Beijerinckiaceae bacterium]|nr:Hpt domain-containing protein [Beijerinckiaceae bacterium]